MFKVEAHATGTNIYGGPINALMAQILPNPDGTGWYATVWGPAAGKGRPTASGWYQVPFDTRIEAAVFARRELGML
jgi:hypothetical protein